MTSSKLIMSYPNLGKTDYSLEGFLAYKGQVKEAMILLQNYCLGKTQIIEATNRSDQTPINLKLPCYILYKFKKTSQLMAKCKVCNISVAWNAKQIVIHMYGCNNEHLSSNTNRMSIKTFGCSICNHSTNSFLKHVTHIVSSIHISNSRYVGNYFSYFCAVCNLFMYSSKKLIKKHWKIHNIGIKFIELPLLSQVLSSNFGPKINHTNNTYVFYCDKKKDDNHFCSINQQCQICKINFCVSSVNDYYFHEVSSEHIILKYFMPNYSSSIKKISNGPIKHTPDTNSELSKNCALNSVNIGNNRTEVEVYDGGQLNKKNGQVINDTILKCVESFENTDVSINSLSDIDQNECGHTFHSNPIKKPNSVQCTNRSLVDVSTSADNLDLKDMCDQLKNIVIQSEPFKKSEKNITSINNISSSNLKKTSNKFLLDNKLFKTMDMDEKYGQYVAERLRSMNNESVKFKTKMEIDYIFYSTIIKINNNTVNML